MADQGVTDATTTDEAGGEGGGEAAPDPIAKLTSAFETFQTDVGSRLERMEQRGQEPEDAGEPDEDGEDEDLPELDFEFADDDFDEQGQLSQDAQMREFARMMRQIAREEQAPIIAEREDQRRVTEADALEERYPALRDEATQDRYVEMTVQAARALGQPELAREPRFFEMVFLQDLGKQGAEAEVPAGSTQGATLERGGGAPPAEGASPNDAIADRIVNVSKNGRFRLGSR